MLHTHSFIYHRRSIMFFSQYFSFPCQHLSTNAPYSFIYHRRSIMFFSQYFSFPRQYHSTNAPYSLIYLPLTLYNVFQPVLQFSLSVSLCKCSTLIHSPTTDAVSCFSPSTSVFPCQYHFTHGPYSFIYLPPTLCNVFLTVLQFSLSLSLCKRSTLDHLSTTYCI